jgi:hypothetical protein
MSRIAWCLTLLRALVLIVIASGTACLGSQDSNTEGNGSQPDRAAFVAELKKLGHVVESKGTIMQPFLSVPGLFVSIDGNDVQTFEYANEMALKTAVAGISPDGSTVGDTRIGWVEPPHFFKKGKLLVLYVGVSQNVTETLNAALGPQVAGEKEGHLMKGGEGK